MRRVQRFRSFEGVVGGSLQKADSAENIYKRSF